MSASRALHWRINCYCNRRCPFCYGPQKKNELRFDDAAPVLESMVEHGIRNFILTGGEPLLSRKIDATLRLLRDLGASVAMYTNCDFFLHHEETILACVDTLCVPLDGASEYSHDLVRGKDNYRAVLEVLDQHAHGRIKLKVGTVLGRHNLTELLGIAYTLERYKIDSWKVYEYLRYEDRDLQKNWSQQQLHISGAEYRMAVDQAIRELHSRNSTLRLVVSTEYDRANSYFMMDPDLKIILPIRGSDGVFEDIPLCDAVSTSPERIEEIWRDRVDLDSYNENITRTFSF